jgi:16S rRNA processing protein RimM
MSEPHSPHLERKGWGSRSSLASTLPTAYAGVMANPSDAAADWIALAHLLRPQGRKGELLAELFTDFPERFADRSRVFLARPNFAGPELEARRATVTNHWLPVGRNHGRVVLSFEGVDSIEKAELLAGLDVLIPAEQRVELEEDTEYISDLIGCTVFDGPNTVGIVTGVDFPSTPDGTRRLEDAAPLLTVESESGDEILIPYVESFLVALLLEQKRIDMKLPPGLLDLNRS